MACNELDGENIGLFFGVPRKCEIKRQLPLSITDFL